MSWDYDKIKEQGRESDNMWSSYSDLFMMLSLVFLLLYVVAGIRSGTDNLQKNLEYQRLALEASDLREQNRVYNTLKDDYLEKQASQKEQETYEQLMDKLSLLKDEAKKEKQRLREEAKENEQKEMALNRYQQIIRNIINANMLAKAGIERRDEIIQDKRETIQEREKTLAQRDKTIEQKDSTIRQSRQQIRENQKTIAQKQRELERKDDIIEESRQIVQQQQQRITSLNLSIEERNQQIEQNQREIQESKQQLDFQIQQLQKKEKNKKKLQARINELKKNTEAKIKELESENKEANEQLASLNEEVESKEAKLKRAQDEQKKFKEYVGSLEKEKDDLAKDLAKSKKTLRAKRDLAKKIRDALKKAGVDAQVDGKSGDVVLNFGNEYFDTNKAFLKPKMQKILKKFVPIYAKSLFGDEKIASKIEAVEVIGFASPTYKGKFIDPQSLNQEDREAVAYNLDLSYQRAKSIFEYMFDTKKMRYKYQKSFLPKVKVSGRSFLSDDVRGRDVEQGLNRKEYCAKYDCKKSQRVILKFDLKD